MTGALVSDTEDIGTWGDWLFEPGHYSALDRTERETSSDDAIRKLQNRLIEFSYIDQDILDKYHSCLENQSLYQTFDMQII